MLRERKRSEVREHLSQAPPAWYEALPAVSAQIDCGGEEHRITWRDGKLVVEDHDVVAEEALSALGGRPPMCLQVLDAWRRATRDSEILYELLIKDSRQSPGLLAVMKAAHETRMRRSEGMAARSAERLERERRRWATTLIKTLPPAFRRALVLSMLLNVERRWADADVREEHAKHVEPALTAIVTPLLEQSARRWRRYSSPVARFAAEASLLAPGETPRCSARADGGGAHADLALPVSWLREVWTPGIALLGDGFVLGLAHGSGGGAGLHVLAARWERQTWETARWTTAPAVVTQSRRGDWRLHWE